MRNNLNLDRRTKAEFTLVTRESSEVESHFNHFVQEGSVVLSSVRKNKPIDLAYSIGI